MKLSFSIKYSRRRLNLRSCIKVRTEYITYGSECLGEVRLSLSKFKTQFLIVTSTILLLFSQNCCNFLYKILYKYSFYISSHYKMETSLCSEFTFSKYTAKHLVNYKSI